MSKKAVVPMIPTSKGEGPQWFKKYDIKWLKGLGDEHPDSERLVGEYEKEYGEII